MLFSTNTKPGQKMEVGAMRLVFTNGSADQADTEDSLNKIFNFYQETKILLLIQQHHIFYLDSDTWETF